MIKDERLLKSTYAKLNDERIKLIDEKSGYPILHLLTIIMVLIAGIISPKNETIALTILAVASFQLIVSYTVEKVYKKIL